jgi:hypothetical protein
MESRGKDTDMLAKLHSLSLLGKYTKHLANHLGVPTFENRMTGMDLYCYINWVIACYVSTACDSKIYQESNGNLLKNQHGN